MRLVGAARSEGRGKGACRVVGAGWAAQHWDAGGGGGVGLAVRYPKEGGVVVRSLERCRLSATPTRRASSGPRAGRHTVAPRLKPPRTRATRSDLWLKLET